MPVTGYGPEAERGGDWRRRRRPYVDRGPGGPEGGIRRRRGGVASRYWPRGDHSKISLKKAAVGVHTLAQCGCQRDRAIVTSELAVKDIDGGGAGGE